MCYYFFAGQEFKPTKLYNGQVPARLVNNNIPPTTNITIPNVPLTTFVKYKKAASAASNKRTIRSALPMFFFI